MKKLLVLFLSCFIFACTSSFDTSEDSGKKDSDVQSKKELSEPIFSPSAMQIDDQTEITIKFDDGAECYYTIDGKKPDKEDGKKYTGPFTLAKSTTVRVGLFKEGYEDLFVLRYYEVEPKSTENSVYLDSLSISGIDDLEFNKLTTNYGFNVPNAMDKAVFYPRAAFGTITVNGTVCETGKNVAVSLKEGENSVVIRVENAGLSKNYIVKIVRQSKNPSNNAKLQKLSVNNGTLIPVFSSDIFAYTIDVDYDVSNISLSYETEDSAAVANASVTNPKDVSLNVGKNEITITVIAEDGKTTQNYSVNVNRADKPAANISCKLLSVSVNGETLNVKSEMETTVDASSVTISAVPEDSKCTVTIDGNVGTEATLNLTDDKSIIIKVDSGSGTFVTYTLKVVVVKKSNAALTSVKVGSSSIGTIQSNMGLNVKEKTVIVTVEANEYAKSVMIDGVETKTATVTVVESDATFGNKSVKITLTDSEGNPVNYYLTLTYQEVVTGKIVVHAYNYTHIWAWNKTNETDNYTGGVWPGTAMTKEEDSDWYTFTIEKTTSMVIFSNGGAGQTPNLEITEGEWWYKDGKWAAYPEDKVPPTVSIVTPTAGANVSGDAVTVEAEANDDREMAYVDFYIDGKKEKTVKALPYSFQWNSACVKNGTHTLKAVAYDASGNSASTEEIEITTSNANIPPKAVISGSKRAVVGSTKSYRGTGSSDINGEIVSYKWSITGAASLDSDDKNSVNITFPNSVSTYTLTLTVTDDVGDTDTTSIDIETYVGTETNWDFRDETIYFAITTRFYDGDKSNNVHCWDENAATPEDDPSWRGDFKGLIEKLDYIKALGFSAVWITPVVENCSGLDYHGYHAMNFSKVDPRYESDDVDFQTLIDEVHARDMKIVLDVVFQHTGNFGEDTLAPMFVKDYVNGDHEDINSILQPHPNTLLDWNAYLAAPGAAQYQMRLALMKNTDGVNHDTSNIYHHYGHGNWDTFSSQWMQIAGDCVDINTENPKALNYIVKAYSQYIEMGVDAFRVDTVKHIPRLVFNKVLNPAFHEAAESAGNNKFFMFGEVCARANEVEYRNTPNMSSYFYTWDEEKNYPWDDSETSWDDYVMFETEMLQADLESGSKMFEHTNANSAQQQGLDYAQGKSHNRSSDNHALNGNKYHTPDHTHHSGLNVIDFPMHWNFNSASSAYGARTGDSKYNDATFNVVYVDSHDYSPSDDCFNRYNKGTDAWAENFSLMFTFRGIPCMYYGSEIEFQAGKIIDKGGLEALCDTGRAYFGDHLEGSVSVSDFGVWSNATGAMKETLEYPLAKHLQRLAQIRRSVTALRKGQYSTEGCSGSMSFKRRYTDENEDSFVLVTISGSSTFTGLPGGTYIDCITGDSQTIGEGGSITATCSGKGNMRVYVLDTAKSPAPGKIGTDTDWLKK